MRATPLMSASSSRRRDTAACIGLGAALIAREDLDVAADRALGHYTHEKSSVGCAAALATLDVIRDEGLLERSRELGAWGLERLRRMQPVQAVRGLGVSFGVEVAGSAVAEAAKTVRGIRGVDVRDWTARVKEGRIVEYKANVKIAFSVEEE